MTRWRPLLILVAALSAGALPASAGDLKAIVRYRLVQQHAPPPGWRDSDHPPTTELTLISVISKQTGLTRFWVAEQRYVGPPDPRRPVHLWIDGRSCLGLNGVVVELSDLGAGETPPPRLRPFPRDAGPITLTGPITPGGGQPLITTDHLGPLYSWWENAHIQLASCWRAQRVTVDGRVLERQIWP